MLLAFSALLAIIGYYILFTRLDLIGSNEGLALACASGTIACGGLEHHLEYQRVPRYAAQRARTGGIGRWRQPTQAFWRVTLRSAAPLIAASPLVSIPLSILCLHLQRCFRSGLTVGSVKG